GARSSLPHPPHPPRRSWPRSPSRRTSSRRRRAARLMGAGPGASWARLHWARAGTRATIRTNMDRSEELRQTPGRPRSGFLAMVERWLPFWEPQLVMACVIALQLSLSEEVTLGPNWLLPALEGATLIMLVGASMHPQARDFRLRRHLAIAMIGLVSAANIVSLVLLSHRLLQSSKQNGHQLILSGIVL